MTTVTTTAPTAATPSGNRTHAAVAYILTWLTGLIIFFVADKNDKYARWHAIQAIGLGIALVIVSIVLNFLPVPFLSTIFWVAALVLIIFLAIKAHKGETIRLPLIADFADKNA